MSPARPAEPGFAAGRRHKAVQFLSAAEEIMDLACGSDLRLYAAAGVPTLHLGPGDVRQAHTVGEYVALDEIAEVAGTLAISPMRLLGVR